MAAPLGNSNGAKRNRMLGDALKRELTQNPDDVVAIAKKVIDLAKVGTQWAAELAFERVDGKMPQAIVGDDDLPAVKFSRVVRTIVDPAKNDGSAGTQSPDR